MKESAHRHCYFLYTLMFHFLVSLLKRGRAVFLTVCLINLCLSRLLIDGIREVTDCSVWPGNCHLVVIPLMILPLSWTSRTLVWEYSHVIFEQKVNSEHREQVPGDLPALWGLCSLSTQQSGLALMPPWVYFPCGWQGHSRFLKKCLLSPDS
jgi:hypothetical protein